MGANLPSEHDLIRRMYEAYNTCDLQQLTSFMSEEVDWPNGDARLHGLAAVTEYWSRLWARVHVHDDVVGVAHVGPEQVAVRVSQVVRNLSDEVVSMGMFEHTYTFHSSLVLQMDLRKLRPEKKECDDV